MVDREPWRKAAVLVRRLRDGMIANDDFEREWPRSTDDRAPRPIAATLWASYSDLYPHALKGRHSLTDYGRAFFDRCALFLDSDLEYQWPRDGCYADSGLPRTLVVLSLGLLLPLYIRQKRRYAEQEAAGESDVWPFIRRSDYERERSRASGRKQ
jgi:hypothetical protein